MTFEIGKFYMHEAGRKIAVLAEVKTFRWGRMLVIEEVDATGHSISCAEEGEANDNTWIEIGRLEFLASFKVTP